MIDEKLKSIQTWTKILGWIMIISGILTLLSLVGIIPLILGWKLLRVSKEAERLLHDPNNRDAEYEFVSELSSFFKIQGVLTVASIIISLLGFIFFFSTFITIISQLG